jgi:exonuclease VII large subunit
MSLLFKSCLNLLFQSLFYYKFKQPTLLYDQQIQRRDDLEKRLKQQIQATFEQQRHRLMLLQQRYNPEFVVSVSFLNHLDVVSVDHTIKLVV